MTTEQIFRSLSDLGSDIEIRSTGDGRTLSGIAVPYNRPTRIDNTLVESFAPGAFAKQVRDPGRIPLARDHMPLGGVLIGRVTMLREDGGGLYAEARIAPTAAGNDTLELIRDGALDSLSIGFRPGQNRSLPGGVVERRSATMTELAVVLTPAYSDAKVMAVRSEDACLECGGECTREHLRARLAEATQIHAQMRRLPPVPVGRRS